MSEVQMYDVVEPGQGRPVQPVRRRGASYFMFSGDPPPDQVFKSLGLGEVTLVKTPAVV